MNLSNPPMDSLKKIIEAAFEERNAFSSTSVNIQIKTTVSEAIALLNSGQARVAEKKGNEWVTHQWLKKAVLLYFRLHDNQVMEGEFTRYFDKVPLKFADASHEDFQKLGCRIVPPACVRYGAYLAPNTILMPSYVNMGAYIDSGTLVDTWATVGSCAQIGKNVHLSGGAGIG